MLPAQLLSVLHRPLYMPSSYPPFAKYAKDGAPAAVLLQFEGRATRHSQLPPLQRTQERGTRCVADAGKIKGLGHSPGLEGKYSFNQLLHSLEVHYPIRFPRFTTVG